MNWFSIQHDEETHVAFVRLFNEIGVGDQTATAFEATLAAMTPARIELEIDSCGGDFCTGLKLFEILKNYPVTTTITGACWSSAVLPSMAGQTIQMAASGSVMIHPPQSICMDTTEGLRARADALETDRQAGAEIIARRTGQPTASVLEWLTNGDHWFTADEAKAAGLIDEILPPAPPVVPSRVKAAPSAMPRTEDEKIFGEWLAAFGKIRVSDKRRFLQNMQNWAAFNVQ